MTFKEPSAAGVGDVGYNESCGRLRLEVTTGLRETEGGAAASGEIPLTGLV